jgi:hypothetical protein
LNSPARIRELTALPPGILNGNEFDDVPEFDV